MTPEEGRRERDARSVALEKAYVHDAYEQICRHCPPDAGRPWPKVTTFLEGLEPGSLVADVGQLEFRLSWSNQPLPFPNQIYIYRE